MNFLERLNEKQREAVSTTEGPVMILAGAGSGKTRTLVSRVAYLLNDLKVSPYQILALTFSNKAAREMRERISMEVQAHMGTLQVQTFHSFCAYVLRSEFQYLGLSRNFTIYDQSESKSIVKAILGNRGVSPKEIPPVAVLYYIDELKNRGHYLGKKAGGLIDQLLPSLTSEYFQDEDYHDYFQEYEQELRKSNALDFGGLITGVLQLFENYPEVLERYRKKYRYILIDEYQDTNRAQFELILQLSFEHRNICVVGDEDQSIYSWRGADIRNILDLDKVFPGLKVIKLEQNYRSSKNIIEAATYVISRNVARKGKEMWTDNPAGDHIEVIECPNDKSEADFISSEVKKLVKKGVILKDVAVFYRTNSQSRVIEESLRRDNISYRVIGGIKFYERKEIKDLLCYLRLIINSRDSLSLSRVINIPVRGIGAITLRKLESAALKDQVSLWEVLEDVVKGSPRVSDLGITGKVKSAIGEFVMIIQEGIDLNKQKIPPSIIYEKILQATGYIETLKASKDYESLGRIENLQELLSALKQYEQSLGRHPTLEGFLETVTLDTFNESEETKELGELSMMTVHGAKGLEFPYVFLVGAEENIFPSYRSLEQAGFAIEEERRLFYVAMTRAMKKLYVCFSQVRMLHGNLVFNGPSRFIHEIPTNLFSWVKLEKRAVEQSEMSARNGRSHGEKERDMKKRSTYSKGTKIIHALYGEGLILESDGIGNDEKVLIRFSGGIVKRFIVKYTPLVLHSE